MEDRQPAKKKYKQWKTDEDVAIPWRTQQRWNANTSVEAAATNTIAKIQPEVHRPEDIDENKQTYDYNSSSSSEEESYDDSIHSSDPDNDLASDNDDSDEFAIHVSGNEFESESDDELYEPTTNVELYNGCKKTKGESILSIMELYIKHKLTKSALKDMLKIICNMLPKDNEMPNTVHKLFQYLTNLAPLCSEIKHYYCKSCLFYHGEDIVRNIECKTCLSNVDCGVFYEFDIVEQIRFLFEHKNLTEILMSQSRRAPNTIGDIIDGSEYIRVNSPNDRGKYDLTLILNTDGISFVKSSKANIWPLMFTIAEIPEHLRESFLIVVGVWYDYQKPLMNTFLQPFCSKLQKCFTNGVSWVSPKTGEKCVSRIIAPLIAADAPARALIQNIQQYNGRYGCNLCEIKTQRSRFIEGRKRTRIYPFPGNEIQLRTHDRMEHQGRKAHREKTVIKGVKGQSVISMLPLLDISTCLIPEYMHSLLLGVVKQFMILWFVDSGPWSLKRYVANIDAFLLNIRPPNTFKRLPRSVSLCKSYKASEFYNWLLYYSVPIMIEYLSDEKFQHWILLVIATFMLLQKNIIEADVDQAEVLLKLFVRDVEILYSDRQLTYNMHQLLHLSLCVRRWGPLWATSAFSFESHNGFLSTFIHGTKNVGQEVTNNLKICAGLQVLKHRIHGFEDGTTSYQKNMKVIGQSVERLLNDTQRENLISQGYNIETIKIYARATVNGQMYTSKIYKSIKSNTYTVHIELEDKSNIYGTITFFFVHDNHMYIVLGQFSILHTEMIYHRATTMKIKHILPTAKSNTTPIIMRMSNVNSICALIAVGNYVCKKPNLLNKVL